MVVYRLNALSVILEVRSFARFLDQVKNRAVCGYCGAGAGAAVYGKIVQPR